ERTGVPRGSALYEIAWPSSNSINEERTTKSLRTPAGKGVRAAAQNQSRGGRSRHRSRHRSHRLRGGAGPRAHDGGARRRRAPYGGRRSDGGTPRPDPRARVRSDRAPRAPGDGGGGPLLRAERPQRVRRRAGARGGDAGRRPGRHPLPLVHAPGGEAGGVRPRPGREGAGAADGRRAPVARRAPGARPRGGRARGRHLPRKLGGAEGGARVIASVNGTVTVRRPDHVVIECGGVGYRLAVSAETLKAVPAVGKQKLLHSHLVMRDDGMYLYGFSSEEEREVFLLLIGVQGVGPKVALAVLSGGTTKELLRAIAAGDSARFQAVPGIGKRTADRIIVELREKVAGQSAIEEIVITKTDDPRTLARQGLVGLGFSSQEADELLADADGETPEDLIGEARRAARGGTRAASGRRASSASR